MGNCMLTLQPETQPQNTSTLTGENTSNTLSLAEHQFAGQGTLRINIIETEISTSVMQSDISKTNEELTPNIIKCPSFEESKSHSNSPLSNSTLIAHETYHNLHTTDMINISHQPSYSLATFAQKYKKIIIKKSQIILNANKHQNLKTLTSKNLNIDAYNIQLHDLVNILNQKNKILDPSIICELIAYYIHMYINNNTSIVFYRNLRNISKPLKMKTLKTEKSETIIIPIFNELFENDGRFAILEEKNIYLLEEKNTHLIFKEIGNNFKDCLILKINGRYILMYATVDGLFYITNDSVFEEKRILPSIPIEIAGKHSMNKRRILQFWNQNKTIFILENNLKLFELQSKQKSNPMSNLFVTKLVTFYNQMSVGNILGIFYETFETCDMKNSNSNSLVMDDNKCNDEMSSILYFVEKEMNNYYNKRWKFKAIANEINDGVFSVYIERIDGFFEKYSFLAKEECCLVFVDETRKTIFVICGIYLITIPTFAMGMEDMPRYYLLQEVIPDLVMDDFRDCQWFYSLEKRMLFLFEKIDESEFLKYRCVLKRISLDSFQWKQ